MPTTMPLDGILPKNFTILLIIAGHKEMRITVYTFTSWTVSKLNALFTCLASHADTLITRKHHSDAKIPWSSDVQYPTALMALYDTIEMWCRDTIEMWCRDTMEQRRHNTLAL